MLFINYTRKKFAFAIVNSEPTVIITKLLLISLIMSCLASFADVTYISWQVVGQIHLYHS